MVTGGMPHPHLGLEVPDLLRQCLWPPDTAARGDGTGPSLLWVPTAQDHGRYPLSGSRDGPIGPRRGANLITRPIPTPAFRAVPSRGMAPGPLPRPPVIPEHRSSLKQRKGLR